MATGDGEEKFPNWKLLEAMSLNVNLDVPVQKLINSVWSSATRHADYICYEENREKLIAETEELRELQADMQREIESARNLNEMPLQQVIGWHTSVAATLEQTDALINRPVESNGCIHPKNCSSRYKIGKEIQAKLRAVASLRERANRFRTVSSTVNSWNNNETGLIIIRFVGGMPVQELNVQQLYSMLRSS